MDPGPQGLKIVAGHLARFHPDVIRCGSPTWLAFLALFLLRQRQHTIRPLAVFVGGERLFPDQRELITDAFGVPVVEVYGNWEYVAFGAECERGRLHLDAEMGFVEVLKDGRSCAPGETGQIVATSLWNHSFPFIRYAIGDVGYLEPDPCPCGRGLPTWRIIGGRQKDLLATPDGYLVLPDSLLAAPRWHSKIRGIRFYQDTRHDVLVQVVKGPAFEDGDVVALREDLEHLLHGRLRPSLQFCDSLEQTVGGKYRYIVSKVPVEI
jgi:phenylacetate-CoA ligase